MLDRHGSQAGRLIAGQLARQQQPGSWRCQSFSVLDLADLPVLFCTYVWMVLRGKCESSGEVKLLRRAMVGCTHD